MAEFDDHTDNQLIEATARGDHAAFGALYARHKQHLWATAVRTARSLDDAEDCLQEAFVRAYQLCGEFRGDCRVASWLHRIVVNRCTEPDSAGQRLRIPSPVRSWSAVA